MNFQDLLSLGANTAATVFSRNSAGETPCAWFPATADLRAVALADYPTAAGQITVGPVKANVAATLGLHMSERESKSMLIQPLAWTPKRGVTTLIAGFPVSGTNTPDPARVKRYRIADFQALPGIWEIVAEEIADMEE